MSPMSCAAIFSSAGFRPAPALPSAGSFSSSTGRISLAQRIVFSISAGPATISAARCSLLCMTTRAMPITPASRIASRSSEYTFSPLPTGSR